MGLTFSPHKEFKDPITGIRSVEHVSDYIHLHAVEIGNLWYVPKDNAYYVAEGETPVDETLFKEKFLPHLSWDFDKWNPIKDKEGNIVSVENKYPPSPENIATERKKLMEKALMGDMTKEQVINKCLPRKLKNSPLSEARLQTSRGAEAVIDRLAARKNI